MNLKTFLNATCEADPFGIALFIGLGLVAFQFNRPVLKIEARTM